MPKDGYSPSLQGCTVCTCQRLAPVRIPLCSYHWGKLPAFIVEYLRESRTGPEEKYEAAIEWAARYLEIEELASVDSV